MYLYWHLLFIFLVVWPSGAFPSTYFDQTVISVDTQSFRHGVEHKFEPVMHYNMTFDDIDLTKEPKKPLEHLFPLDFLRIEAINTSLAAEHDVISRKDKNCAVKGPNAILTSRLANSPSRITFEPELHGKHNVSEFFDLESITLKPLGPAPRFVIAEINAWRIRNGTALKVDSVYVSWGQKGFVPPIVGKFGRWFPGWGEGVNALEISAYTQDKEPWQLCIGRLEFDLKEGDD